jgi:pyruvate dehydrogenase E2 component (dihydrolipoamide acetyltransferase)
METGTVQRWIAGQGQHVEAGEAILEVETDKVVVEVEAPATGLLGSLLIQEGDNVPIGTVLARIYAPGEQRIDDAETRRHGEPAGTRPPVSVQSPVTPFAPVAAQEETRADVHGRRPGRDAAVRDVREAGLAQRIFSSPRARKRAQEAGLDWRGVRGSGPMGRVIERDVLLAAAKRPLTIDHGPLGIDQRSSKMDLGPSSIVHRPSSGDDVTWETPSLVQRVAASRMAASFGSAPHFYLSAEVRADALLELRDRLLPAVEQRTGVRLTVTDVMVKIAAVALAEHPRANAFWDPAEGGRIGLHREIYIGVAVATGAGLVVPVLRGADGMGLAQIAAERSRLVEKAREGKLLPDDLEGSTFTLTNLGSYRVDAFQAILNPPQSAILSVGRIAERPFAIAGQLCVRPTMVVTLSCDHRVLDGVQGAQFLGRVVELIEEPAELLAGRRESHDNRSTLSGAGRDP